MKVPFSKIQFLNACVSFSIFIEEFGHEITFEVDNPDIRPEFEAIKEYFSKVLKKKLISVEIKINFTEVQINSTSASSDDIEKINSSLIDSVRFEFVKRKYRLLKENLRIQPL